MIVELKNIHFPIKKIENLSAPIGEDEDYHLDFDLTDDNIIKQNVQNSKNNKEISQKNTNVIHHGKKSTKEIQKKITFESITLKIKLILKHFLLIQLLAFFLTIFFMILQNTFENSCVLPSEKIINHENILMKIYEIFKYTFFFKTTSISTIYFSIFHFPVFSNHKFYKIFFLIFCYTFVFLICAISVFTNNLSFYYGQIYINITAYVLILIFYVVYFILLRTDLKAWFLSVLKGGGLLATLLTFHQIMIRTIIMSFIEELKKNYEPNTARNIKQTIFLVYSILFKFCLQKLLFFYYETLLSENLQTSHINMNMIVMNRITFSHYVTMNVISILQAKIKDLAGWFVILNYFLFLLYSYTRIDVIGIVFTKILRFFRFKINDKTENFKNFEKIFSGCCIDVQFILCLRLLVIYFWKKWSIETVNKIFFQDCYFEISEKFIIYFLPLVIIIIENVFILIAILFFVLFTHKKVFVYKIFDNFLLNMYLLFSFHYGLENLLQLYSKIFIGESEDYF